MRKNRERAAPSIRKIWRTFFLVVLLVMGLVLAAVSWLVDRALRMEAAQNSLMILEGYMEQLDQQLTAAESQLFPLAVSLAGREEADVRDEAGIYMAQRALSASMEAVLLVNPVAEGMWYSRPASETVPFLASCPNLRDYSEMVQIRTSVVRLNQGNIPSGWFLYPMGDGQYLVRMACYGGLSLGMWIRADTILSTLEGYSGELGSDLFLGDQDGRILERNRDGAMDKMEVVSAETPTKILHVGGRTYIQAAVQSGPGRFLLVSVLPLKNVLKQVAVIKPILAVVAVLLVMLFGLELMFTERLFYRPSRILLRHMEMAQKGDLDSRIDEDGKSVEFAEIFGSFNRMKEEIRCLKIDNYERQLAEEKTKRQFLQTQIKSHFFLNCLNIIYSLAELRDYRLIQKMDLHMVQHMRYLARREDEPVTVAMELEHIRNYMEIQKLRYPGQFSYTIEVEPECEQAAVYPLVLHSFVENAVKHGVDPEKESRIAIAVSRGKDRLIFVVTDNGAGFLPELLDTLNESSGEAKLYGLSGVGIANCKSRLALHYREEAMVRFANIEPSGARVEISFPFTCCR